MIAGVGDVDVALLGSTATPLGALRPEATTVAAPAGVTLTTSLSAASAMYTSPAGSTATPLGVVVWAKLLMR